MKLGAMNNPRRDLMKEIERVAKLGLDFIDLTIEAPAATPDGHDWTTVRQQCHHLLQDAMRQIEELTGLPPIYAAGAGFYHQMAAIPLPPIRDVKGLKAKLYQAYRVEVPLVEWNGRVFIRVSIQGYNSPDDVAALLNALAHLLPEFTA